MGNCMSPGDNGSDSGGPGHGGSTPKGHPQSQEPSKVTVQEETSTVLREELINLHAKAKRASVEATKAPKDEVTDGLIDENKVNKEVEKIIPPTQEEMKAQVGAYKRLKNVFASPLQILEGYTPPSFPKSSSETQFLDKCLHDNFIFSGLTPKEIALLIDAMEHYHASEGELIIQQGDIGDYFYVLQRGKVTFLVNGKKVGQARKGGSFGELALLYDSPRAATARAETECTLFRVDQQSFRAMMANNKAKANKENIDILRRVEFFQNMEEATLTKISDALTAINFHDGDFIIRKGEVGKVFYMIKQGKVIITDVGGGEKRYADQTLGVGDCFGERALLTGERRAANIKAVGDCVMLALSKDTFEKAIGPVQDVVDVSMDKRKLKGVPVIAKAKLEPYEIDRMARKLKDIEFKQGEVIVKEGDKILKFEKLRGLILIKTGKITMTNQGGAVNILTKGDYLGEMSLRADEDEISSATFVATEETQCKHLALEDIIDIIGSIERLEKTSSVIVNKLDPTVTMDVLEKHTILGAGTFGQVWLVTNKNTSIPAALKIQNKRDLLKHGQVDGVIREKNLMASIDHPFVIKLINAFQDPQNLFMVMNLVQGGELFSVIHTDTSDGVAEEAAKFYAACVHEGLSHMHHRHILYRDLKPENVLIDKDGYCVLIDLGFAKVVTEKTYTLCGTPLYLAPEIILSRGYDKGVDHWSFAVLVFEMIMGYSPFYSHNIDQMTLFKRIVKVQYSFPDWAECSNTAQDLIQKILVLKQAERLGSLAGGDLDITNHKWFEDISVDKLMKKKIKSPWIPNIKDPLDASNFEDWGHLDDKMNTGPPAPSEKEQKIFKDF